MKDATFHSRAPNRSPTDAPGARGPGLTRWVSGLLGTAVIGGTLAVVRLWAWLTRTPFYKD